MTIKIVYSPGKGDNLEDLLLRSLVNLMKEEENGHFPTIEVVSYNEEHYKERKDAFQLKASCGARLTPFCAIYNDDKELIKAFYSEVGECTIHNIIEYLKNEIL